MNQAQYNVRLLLVAVVVVREITDTGPRLPQGVGENESLNPFCHDLSSKFVGSIVIIRSSIPIMSSMYASSLLSNRSISCK